MEQIGTSPRIYNIENSKTDYSISSLVGLSIGIVTTIFAITLWAIDTAQLHFLEILSGDFHIHGDPTLLHFAIFLIAATMLIVVQHHFQEIEEEE